MCAVGNFEGFKAYDSGTPNGCAMQFFDAGGLGNPQTGFANEADEEEYYERESEESTYWCKDHAPAGSWPLVDHL